MDNPYWHPEEKRHVVDINDVRLLAFNIFNIVRSSMSMMGAGIALDEEEDDATLTPIENLHYKHAEKQLLKHLLRLAILMRTLDDYWLDLNHKEYIQKVGILNENGIFGIFGSADLTLREALNKIIHAQDIRPVYDSEDDIGDPNIRWGMDSQIELEGKHCETDWKATIHVLGFLDGVIELTDFVETL